jgi:hypothetical protein
MTVLAGSIGLALTNQAHAAIITVDGVGCLLADAITAANGDSAVGGSSCTPGSGDDVINIAVPVTLSGELPTIVSNIAFAGSPGDPITGDGTHRLFMIGDAFNAPTVSFTALTLTGGIATGGAGIGGGGGGGGLGGAIFVYDGNVSLNAVTFSSNTATGGSSSGVPFNTAAIPYIGSSGGGGGGMFGSGGSIPNFPTSDTGGPGNAGGFGSGGGAGGVNDSEFGGGGGAGGVNGGSGGTFGVSPTAGGPGEFGGGGGGGGPGQYPTGVSQPGGSGGFGGGGGGGAGQCYAPAGTFCNSNGPAGNGGAGGFGGGGGAGGSFVNAPGASGGAGGFGGGGGADGASEGGSALAGGGFGGGDAALYLGQTVGGGGGGGLGGAIFVRSGYLDVQNSTFSSNAATGGGANANANPGQGKGGAIFTVHILTSANGNDQGLPTVLPNVSGCSNTFSGNSAGDAGTMSRDNADTFGADQVGLTLICNDRIFADGFGAP